MNIDTGVVKHARRLLVEFAYYFGDIIRTDDGNRPQLVHFQKKIEKPSLLIQFATRLGLTKGVVAYKYPHELIERCVEDKPMMNAVEKAYAFVSGNYRQGDQVTLLVYSYFDRLLDAAEMLAKHLHDGTRPGGLSRVQSKNVGDVPPGRIPIHCVAVSGLGGRSVSERNDELKSMFPPGIEHIICWGYVNGTRTCATRYDADGSTISREIYISENGGYGQWMHCTKNVIYYNEYQIPKWDDQEPVWTHKLDSSPSDVQGSLPLEATKPFGIISGSLCPRPSSLEIIKLSLFSINCDSLFPYALVVTLK
ncbi:unnamed protein product [Rhizoctonia solani]|uniref:Uncharacterized protein n=1 Tax=Rhizoctonia solani TaxID=456999 RepID=A0A8H3CT20_9AGAM|nr:unnamed protein product [Rhizoctonia solani]